MSWMTVAKKEYLENVRNAWVITVTAIFLVLTLTTSWVVGLFAGGDAGSFADIVMTLNALDSVGGFLLPILALVLGFGTIAGERESGSLALLAAQRLSRGEIVLGKWLGLWGVLSTAIVAGFGLGGLVVLTKTSAGAIGVMALLAFVIETLAWGAAWISVTLLLSAFFQRRGTAIAGAVGIWFLMGSLVWSILTLMVGTLVMGERFGGILAGEGASAPPLLILTQLLNPNTVYDGLLTTTIDGYETLVGGIGKQVLPELYTFQTFALAMALWIALPFWGALALFRRKDI